ncbi:MAG: hypothetical protein A2096_12800 [Spirochaetes bacterium GWF1_41_5]|nr:MAG: hypothetical protein A2096_12800 [Spirochaetes bacterium GWF1_41_5]HBE04059.1 hypothetical protein [Spirochaetia bacterium]
MNFLAAKIFIEIEGAHSLKDKRSILNRLKACIFKKFKITVIEDSRQDKHNEAVLGLVFASLSADHCSAKYNEMISCIELQGFRIIEEIHEAHDWHE